jgi:hypothetical protein
LRVPQVRIPDGYLRYYLPVTDHAPQLAWPLATQFFPGHRTAGPLHCCLASGGSGRAPFAERL